MATWLAYKYKILLWTLHNYSVSYFNIGELALFIYHNHTLDCSVDITNHLGRDSQPG